jgi:hypothetical protein
MGVTMIWGTNFIGYRGRQNYLSLGFIISYRVGAGGGIFIPTIIPMRTLVGTGV